MDAGIRDRSPGSPGPVMILDRYILREFISYLLIGLLAFVGIFIIVDIFEKIDTFVDAEAPATLVFRFYLSYVPVVMVDILPVAVLLATLLSLGRFARFNELTAMRVAGRSLLRIYQPIILFVVLIAAAAFVMGELVVPEANYRRKKIMDREIRQRPEFPSRRQDVRYIGQGGRIYILGSYDVRRSLMRDVVIQEFSGGTLARRIDARQGRWAEDHWELVDGYVRAFGGDSLSSQRFADLRLDVPEVPEDFTKEERDPEQMGYRDLKHWIERFRQSGGEARAYLVDLHSKIASPFINLITVLLGASLFSRVRRGGKALGFGLSLLISFVYYALIRAGQALGHGGTLPPALAAWMANIIFGLVGLILMMRTHRGT
jgi:lipopolysaccharide export system permease protein